MFGIFLNFCSGLVGCWRSVEMASLHQYSGPLANGLEGETLALDLDDDTDYTHV